MTVMIAELYEALKDAGASDDKARAAARAVSDNDARLARIEGQIEGLKGEIGGLKSQADGLKAQIDALKMRIDALTWVVGLNSALLIAILVRLFFS